MRDGKAALRDNKTAVPKRAQIYRAVCAALAEIGGGGEINVRYVDAKQAEALNRRYRGGDKATNVLSFDYRPGGDGGDNSGGALLGDIVICDEVIQQEAALFGLSPYARHIHLLVHGVLHLAGYVHSTPALERQMQTLEKTILKRLNMADPYQ